MSTPEAVKLRDLAVSAAREAGRLLTSREGKVDVAATKSSPTDVVTEMDRRSEELIRSRILAARPSDARGQKPTDLASQRPNGTATEQSFTHCPTHPASPP